MFVLVEMVSTSKLPQNLGNQRCPIPPIPRTGSLDKYMHLSGVGVKEINEYDVVRPFESLPDDSRLKSINLNLDAIIRNHFNSGNGSDHDLAS